MYGPNFEQVETNEKYDTQVTTSSTISPSGASSNSALNQENNSSLIQSADVLLLVVAALFLAVVYKCLRSVKLKHELDLSSRDREKLRQANLLLEKELGQIDPPPPPPKVQFLHTFNATIYREPKSDEILETCADMAKVNITDQIFTIADGVSQAFNSAHWANLLVNNITTSRDTPTLIELIPALAGLWDADCEKLLQNKDPHSFSRQKQLQGSQSTLASLRLLKHNDDLCWRFHTIGDSLLVVVNASDSANPVQKFMPFTKVEDFPSGPDILSTKAPHLRGHIKTFEIPASKDQKLLLMTDALARYAVAHRSAEIDINSIFPFLGGSNTDFADWLQNARQNGLGDDDSTLIMIYPNNE